MRKPKLWDLKTCNKRKCHRWLTRFKDYKQELYVCKLSWGTMFGVTFYYVSAISNLKDIADDHLLLAGVLGVVVKEPIWQIRSYI